MDWNMTQMSVDFMQNQATLALYRSATLTAQAATVTISFQAADNRPLTDAAQPALIARAKQALLDAANALDTLPMTAMVLASD
jgi:hypothetical protein